MEKSVGWEMVVYIFFLGGGGVVGAGEKGRSLFEI